MLKFNMRNRIKDPTYPDQVEGAPTRVAGDKPLEFSFSFEIDNIKSMNDDEPVHSHPFSILDLVWKIIVRKCEEKDTLGFFLLCEPSSERLDSDWRCFAATTFTIVNRKNSSNNLSRMSEHWYCKEEIDWGYPSFYKLNELYNSNFIASNSVKFKVSIVADTPQFSGTNDENSEDKDSVVDEAEESDDAINIAVHDSKNEMNSLNANLPTEMNSLKTDIQKDLSEINSLCTNLRAEMSSLKTDLRSDLTKMNTLLASDLQTEISSLKTDLKTDFAEIMNGLRNDLIAELKSEGDNSGRKICSGEKQKVVENAEHVESPAVRKENETTSERVDCVETEVPANSSDDFEIVSRVDGKNNDSKDSSFEMVSKDTSNDNRTCSVSEKITKCDLPIDIVEEYFSRENDDCPVTTAAHLPFADAVRDRLLEILDAPVEGVMKGDEKNTTTDQEKKYKVGKYVVERLLTLVNDDMVEDRLTDTATNGKSIDAKSDIPESSYSSEIQRENVDRNGAVGE